MLGMAAWPGAAGAAAQTPAGPAHAAHYGPIPGTNVITTPAAPAALVFHPEAPYAYVPARHANDIILYRTDPRDGRMLSFGSVFSEGRQPTFGASFDAAGRMLYLPNAASNSIAQFAFEPATGGLRWVDTVDLSGIPGAGLYPYVITLDPENIRAYVTMYRSSRVLVFEIEAETGRLDFRSMVETGPMPVGLFFDSEGHYAVVNNQAANRLQLFEAQQGSGELSLVQNFEARGLIEPFFAQPFPGRELFYALAGGVNAIFHLRLRVDAGHARLEQCAAPVPTGVMPNTFLALSEDRAHAFEANYQSNDVSMYRVDACGVLSPLSPPSVATGPGPIQIKAMPGTDLFYSLDYLSNTIRVYRLGREGQLLPERFE